jgi:hypothetical protein
MIATTSQSSRQERLRGTNFSDSPIPARLSRLFLAPGGQIALSHGQDPKVYNIRLGALRQRYELVPRRQLFGRSQQAWVNDLNAIPKFEKMPPPS